MPRSSSSVTARNHVLWFSTPLQTRVSDAEHLSSEPCRNTRGPQLSRADEAFYDARWQEIIESLLNVCDQVEDAARGTAFVAIDGLSELHEDQDQTGDLNLGCDG